MGKSSEALTVLQKHWQAMETAHPRENGFSDDGRFDGISYDSIATVFDEWKSIIETLDAKGSWTSTPEMVIQDRTLTASIMHLDALVQNGISSGPDSLLSGEFFDRISSIGASLNAIATKRISVSRNLAKALASGAEAAAHKVIEGAKSVDKILKDAPSIRKGADDIESLASQAQTIQQQLELSQKQIETLEAQVKTNAAAAESALGETTQAKSGASKAKGEIDALKAAAVQREAELEERVRQANASVDALKSEADAAKQSVQQALRLARDQGLAKSFQDRSGLLNSERRLWILGFLGAAVVLLAVGITFALDLHDLTYELLLTALLRKAALVAPAVWVGWYCAKQIGKIAKVQEDYEYKAASALAYQSYKEEASINPDSDLREQLLRRAIETFGENPVRLYEDGEEELHSPAAELLAKLKPDRLAELLGLALAKALEKK